MAGASNIDCQIPYTDEFLRTKGIAAADFLVSKIKDAPTHRQQFWLLCKLAEITQHPNQRFAAKLITQVERESHCTGKASSEWYVALRDRFRLIGRLGDESSVQYLEKWLSDPSYLQRIQCSRSSGNAQSIRNELWRMIAGDIANNPSAAAKLVLEKQSKHPLMLLVPADLLERQGRVAKHPYRGRNSGQYPWP